MKAIILGGGQATRLRPMSTAVNKQLLPVWDKPMVYYPIATAIDQGCDDILIISAPEYVDSYSKLLKSLNVGSVRINIAIQHSPLGIAQAYIIARDWLNGEDSILILGDNIFHADKSVFYGSPGVCTVFTSPVDDPTRYGIISRSESGGWSIEEKPETPKSNSAIVGFYRMPGDAPERASLLKPSKRGELEITDLIASYDHVHVLRLGSTSVWIDAGTAESFFDAAAYVRAVQARTGIVIGSPEFSAVRSGFLDVESAMGLADERTSYGKILRKSLDGLL